MQFETGHLYHIYNRGNNSQKIFYNRENYLFFLRKIRQYIIPYADILAWVLMPNHFHIMVYVKSVAIGIQSQSLTQSETLTLNTRSRTINDSIGVLLRTYARAIQKQEKMVGSLFQEHTKASCLTNPDENDFKWFYKDYTSGGFGDISCSGSTNNKDVTQNCVIDEKRGDSV